MKDEENNLNDEVTINEELISLNNLYGGPQEFVNKIFQYIQEWQDRHKHVHLDGFRADFEFFLFKQFRVINKDQYGEVKYSGQTIIAPKHIANAYMDHMKNIEKDEK